MFIRKTIVPEIARKIHRTFKSQIPSSIYDLAKEEGVVLIFSTEKNSFHIKGLVDVEIHTPSKTEFSKTEIDDIFDRKGRYKDLSVSEKIAYLIAAELGLYAEKDEPQGLSNSAEISNILYQTKKEVFVIDEKGAVQKTIVVMLHKSFIKMLRHGNLI